MTTSKHTKKALLASVLSMLLCVTMLVGSTFAWFTDSVTSGKNTITAGNLDVELEYAAAFDEDGNVTEWETVDKDVSLFKALEADGATANLWEPGHTEVAYLRVRNAGTLALKYKFAVDIASETTATNVDGKEFKLSEHLVFGQAADVQTKYANREAAWTAAGETKGLNAYIQTSDLLLPQAEEYVALIVYMPTSVGNEANYRGDVVPAIDLGVNLVAAQTPHESDSFGSDYDADAEYPYIDNNNGTFNKVGDDKLYAKVADEYVAVEPYAGVNGLYLDEGGNAYAATKAAMTAVARSSYDLPNGYENTNLTLIQDITIAPHQQQNRDGYFFLNNSVVDLNGKTLTVNTNNQFMFVGKDITVKNGTIKAGSDSIAYPVAATFGSQNVVFEDIVCVGGIQVLGNSTVTLRNVTSTATLYYNVYIAGGTATVTIESGTYTDNGKAHFFIQDPNCKAIVNDGTFSGDSPTYIGNGQLINNMN